MGRSESGSSTVLLNMLAAIHCTVESTVLWKRLAGLYCRRGWLVHCILEEVGWSVLWQRLAGPLYCGRGWLVHCTAEEIGWSTVLRKRLAGPLYCGRGWLVCNCGRGWLVHCTVEEVGWSTLLWKSRLFDNFFQTYFIYYILISTYNLWKILGFGSFDCMVTSHSEIVCAQISCHVTMVTAVYGSGR
jgi:hypothetical protein